MIDTIRNMFSSPKVPKTTAELNADKAVELREKNEIIVTGYGGLNVGGLVAPEFSYLIRGVSSGRHQNFDDLKAIGLDAKNILTAIDAEIKQPVLLEESSLVIPHDLAVYNMENLKRIIQHIDGYMQDLSAYGIPLEDAFPAEEESAEAHVERPRG